MSNNTYTRDPNSNAIVSSDVVGLQQYKMRKQQTMRVEELKQEVNSLKDDMTEIKNLLQTLVKTI